MITKNNEHHYPSLRTMPAFSSFFRAIPKTVSLSVVIALGGMSLTACVKSSKPITHEASPLVQIASPQNVLSQVFQSDITSRHHGIKNVHLHPKQWFSKKKTLPAKVQMPTIFTVAHDGQGYVTAQPDGTMAAYNAQGRKVWQTKQSYAIDAGVAVSPTGDMIVVSDDDAHVIALNRQTGSQLWRANLASNVLAPALIANNRVITLGNDGTVSGFSADKGELVWQFSTPAPAVSVRGSATPTLLDANTVLVATADGRIHALNLADGIALWSRRISVVKGASEIDRLADIDATPVVSDNMLYVITYSGQLAGIDMAGRQINFIQDYASLKSVAADSSQLYVTTLTGEVLALDKFTGKILWQNKTLGYRGLTNPVLINNRVIVADADGFIHVLAKDTGTEIDRKQSNTPIATLTAHGANQVIAQNGEGGFGVWQVN